MTELEAVKVSGALPGKGNIIVAKSIVVMGLSGSMMKI